MLGVPQTSPWDLNFRLLNVPIRVSPMFWIITVVLGWGDGDFQHIVIWLLCVFISIIAHEMGHALTNRLFGRRASIVLHGMGGLCFSEGQTLSAWKRILVLLNGPMAGFMLLGVAIGAKNYLRITDMNYREILNNLIQINLMWGIFNLIPVWPMDGGQIMGVVLQKISPRKGQEFTHGLSLLVSVLIGILIYQKSHDVFIILLMGMIAMNNFQMLQLLHQHHWATDEIDDEWWRR